MAACALFFDTERIAREVNSTIITLVPKKYNADKMKDFGPISCCNTFYECITKVIANILKKVLPMVISPNQSALIEGRRIVDNVLLAHELVRKLS